MKWWNDLWLNESFAEWASTIATAEATEWTRRGRPSHRWRRAGPTARTSSRRRTRSSPTSTTSRTCRSTSTASPTPRARSVLKQLVAWVGLEPSSPASREYFKKHAWGNTELADLLGELEKPPGRELTDWSKLWLETAGVNTLRPELRGRRRRPHHARSRCCRPRPTEYPTHPPAPPRHRLLRPATDGKLVRERIGYDELDVDGERTEVAELVGQEQPDLVLLNDDDLAYAKIRLDERSLATALGTSPAASRARWPARSCWARPGTRPATARCRPATSSGSSSSRCRARPTRRCCASCSARPPRPRASTRPRAPRRGLGPAVVLAALARRVGRGRAATPSSSSSRPGRAARPTRPTSPGCGPCSRARESLPGLTVDTELRWTFIKALAALGAADEAEIAGRARPRPDRHGQGARRRGPRRPSDRRGQGRRLGQGRRAQRPVQPDGRGDRRRLPSQHRPVPARALRRAATTRCSSTRGPSAASPSASASSAASTRSRSPSEQLKDASDAWLAANPDAAPGLVRTVAENRDTIARALVAQERDRRG